MELWIRSQDRTLFEKAFMVKVGTVDNIPVIIVNNDYVYAEYKTKERVLEVLDEIQSKLFPKMLMQLKEDGPLVPTENIEYFNDVYNIKLLPRFAELKSVPNEVVIYEMPKE